MSTDDGRESTLDPFVKDSIYAKDAAESARHVIAREIFLSLYFEKPEVKALIDGLIDEWTRRIAESLISRLEQLEQLDKLWEQAEKKIASEIMAFVSERGIRPAGSSRMRVSVRDKGSKVIHFWITVIL